MTRKLLLLCIPHCPTQNYILISIVNSHFIIEMHLHFDCYHMTVVQLDVHHNNDFKIYFTFSNENQWTG